VGQGVAPDDVGRIVGGAEEVGAERLDPGAGRSGGAPGRAVARVGEGRRRLYGRDAYEASRIDGFLDASLIFARDAQLYLLALMSGAVAADVQRRARDAFDTYARGIEQALAPDREFLVGDDVTLADICFVAEWVLFLNERAGSVALGLEPIVRS